MNTEEQSFKEPVMKILETIKYGWRTFWYCSELFLLASWHDPVDGRINLFKFY